MARVVALVPDLMFASKIEETLRAAGNDVQLVSDDTEARVAAPQADVFIVDLSEPDGDPLALVESMLMGDELHGVPTLGFYPHVDEQTKLRAEQAGFDLVVPRSRMAREMPALVEQLASR